QLKAKLAAEGLFDAATKREIPAFPKKIALVTSTTGAAIRDVLSVIERRAPQIPVMVFPTPVQGEAAASSIIKALEQVQTYGECDVVLLVRGGGSLEDLWCFNDESLARVIAGFPIPVVSGVGHEIDFTIADFVADLRAPTPSVAAESITPDRNELMQNLDDQVGRLLGQLELRLAQSSDRLGYLTKILERQHPARQFEQIRLRMKHASTSLLQQIHNRVQQERHRLEMQRGQLQQLNPKLAITHYGEQIKRLLEDHQSAMRRQLLLCRHQLTLNSRSLDNLSPLKTLSRGFATVSKDEQLVTSVKQLNTGDEVEINLADGKVPATVKTG
ncbi:MAG: exodeoxyribonuclease VII large subunit, partial [Pseudomonadota bacterium]